MGCFYNVYISLYKIYDNSNNINIYNVVRRENINWTQHYYSYIEINRREICVLLRKYIGLPIFKKKPIGRYGPQKISWNHCHRMSWATHVKIQNLGLADTCSPSGKNDTRFPSELGYRGGRRHDWRSTSGAIFFLQWMALDGVFLLASAP